MYAELLQRILTAMLSALVSLESTHLGADVLLCFLSVGLPLLQNTFITVISGPLCKS